LLAGSPAWAAATPGRAGVTEVGGNHAVTTVIIKSKPVWQVKPLIKLDVVESD